MSGHQRIFLGHASEDKPQVRELYDQLKSHGFSPWLDAVDLIPGQNWRDEIPNAIKDAGIFLACLSKRSVEKQGYVQREFRYALSAYAERPPNSIYLIPVRLDKCEVPDLRLPELELNLRDLHWVDLFEEDGFELLVGAIQLALSAAPAAAPETSPPAPTKTKPVASQRAVPGPQPSAPSPAHSPTTRNPAIIAAWIGAGAVVAAGTLSSPWLIELFKEPVQQKSQTIPAEVVRPAAGPDAGNPPASTSTVVDAKAKPTTAEPAPSAEFKYRPFETFRDCDQDLCQEMVMLPAGTFLMGSDAAKQGPLRNASPPHEVTISRPFALGKYEVTFEEYDRFAEATGREKPEDEEWGRRRRPAINVSWYDASEFCAWLGQGYRLPSEAEWEYAARAGTTTFYSFGDDITHEQANFDWAPALTVEVGSYPANPWGLHDMHGNVTEWVWDWMGDYSPEAVTDPSGPTEGTKRVARGGSWFEYAWGGRSDLRREYKPSYLDSAIGFRCARDQEGS